MRYTRSDLTLWAGGLFVLVAFVFVLMVNGRANLSKGCVAGHRGAHAAGHAPQGAGDPLPANAGTEYSRRFESYEIPDVTLRGRDGGEVSLASVLDVDAAVMLNFIFTSCTTICPAQTATFAEVQKRLGAERDEVQMVSISIDPQYDTPTRLADYAARYRAQEPWHFLTGEPASVRSVEHAFNAYRGDKMNHVPLTFLRASPDDSWLRIQGFPSAADLVREYRGLVVD